MVNRVTLVGNLGQDPEIRYTSGGTPVCNLSIATNESWTDKSGEKQTKTEWHKIVCWAKLAETVAKYCRKGSQIYLEGRLTYRDWTDKEGVKRVNAEIVASTVRFIGKKEKREEPERAPETVEDSDIPF
jgi:single-strand DNA-binding protein